MYLVQPFITTFFVIHFAFVRTFTMKFLFIAALAGLAHMASAVGVVGKAEGFAAGVTGGGKIDIRSVPCTCTDALHQAVPLLSTPRTSRSSPRG